MSALETVNTGGTIQFVYEKSRGKDKNQKSCDRCGAVYTKKFYNKKDKILCNRCYNETKKLRCIKKDDSDYNKISNVNEINDFKIFRYIKNFIKNLLKR